MTTTATTQTPPAPLLTRNKVGLALLGLIGLLDVFSVLGPTPDGEVGPPFGILVLDSLLGLVTIVFVVVALRTRSRGAIRIVAGARIVSVLTAVPAFFAGVPAAVVLLVAVDVVVTFVGVVLALTPPRRSHAVVD
ncbi:hypothetical protein [Cellulomonas sp. URHD0024]|uniref:hypothetical protein n=1 Tax=Cellulomonas sp. URHD0024 TaxID=1302620 RepID=UPI0012DF3F84|nr:hypothetical protein [Cellulomonas sp. URHD0024]